MADTGKPVGNEALAQYNLKRSADTRRDRTGKYDVYRCSSTCGLGPGHNGPELFDRIHKWYEDGLSDAEIGARLDELGEHRSDGSIGRHRRKHLQKVVPGQVEKNMDALAQNAPARGNLGILEDVIRRGAATIPTSKITPDLLVKAIDMHDRMTRGKSVDAAMEAIRDAMKEGFEMQGEDEEQWESPMDVAERLAEDPNA